MKKTMLMITGVLFCTLVFAGGTPDEKTSSASGVAVMKKSAATFQLLYKSATASSVTVTIRDAKGREVFNEVIAQDGGFARPYNFEGLREGDYTLTVEDASGKHSEQIRYSTAADPAAHLVRLTGADNRFLLTYANRGSQRIRVNIYDANDELVHSGAYEASGDFAKIFNLKEIAGAVTFVVSSGKGVERLKY